MTWRHLPDVLLEGIEPVLVGPGQFGGGGEARLDVEVGGVGDGGGAGPPAGHGGVRPVEGHL